MPCDVHLSRVGLLNVNLKFSRNVSELETVQRAIHHIPELLDAAMAAMMETNIQPPEVEVT